MSDRDGLPRLLRSRGNLQIGDAGVLRRSFQRKGNISEIGLLHTALHAAQHPFQRIFQGTGGKTADHASGKRVEYLKIDVPRALKVERSLAIDRPFGGEELIERIVLRRVRPRSLLKNKTSRLQSERGGHAAVADPRPIERRQELHSLKTGDAPLSDGHAPLS